MPSQTTVITLNQPYYTEMEDMYFLYIDIFLFQ